MKYRINVAIVTFNRKEYLINLLNALKQETYSICNIFIFDNASNDGTESCLKSKGFIDWFSVNELSEKKIEEYNVCYYKNNDNIGGAGGFEKVIQMAHQRDCDYIWVMDDDVLPESDCLEKLIKKCTNGVKAVLPSRQDDRYKDEIVIKYNLNNPFIFRRNKIKTKINYEDICNDTIQIEAVPFEGPLISSEIISEIGYPDSSFFIFYDDTDYSQRIIKFSQILYVKDAVLHKQIIPVSGDFSWRDYYGDRNLYLFDMKHGKNFGVKHIRPFLLFVSKYVLCRLHKSYDEAKVVKVAYLDARKRIVGKTMIPNKLSEYINSRN